MFFDEDGQSLRILSVLSFSYKESCANVTGRPFHALSFRTQGDAVFTHGRQSFHAKKGDVIFVPKGVDYTINSRNDELIVVHCDAEIPDDALSFITPYNIPYIEKKFRDLLAAWSRKLIGYRYECNYHFNKLLSVLYRQHHEQQFAYSDDYMSEIIEYIHDHFRETGLGVRQLADMAGMSDTYFRKSFVSACQITPHDYINRLRVSYALELLRSGYYTIGEVAELAGFNNQKYFSTVIRKCTGQSPNTYKKEDL